MPVTEGNIRTRFSNELGFGKQGHEALIALNESEIKLLESVKSYIEKRARIDLEYVDKITKLHASYQSNGGGAAEEGGLINKAWRTFLTESENKSIVMAQMAKNLQQTTLPKIQDCLCVRKEMLKKYTQDWAKFDRDFVCCKEEVKRLNETYRAALKETVKTRNKLDEMTSKGKDNKEWKKAKDRFDKSSRKLHTNHNDYVLAISSANEYQKTHIASVVPYLLDSMQDIQENYVSLWQKVMTEILNNTSWCEEEFITSAHQVQQCIDIIDKDKEYLAFLEKNKKTAQPVVPFFFEETLITEDKVMSGLIKDDLALNDLTHEQLKYRLKTLENQLESFQRELRNKEDALNIIKSEMEESQQDGSSENQSDLSYLDKLSQYHYIKREIEELKCKDGVSKVQYDLVKVKVDELGDCLPPAYSTIEPPSAPVLYPDLKAPSDRKNRARSLNFTPQKDKKNRNDRRSLTLDAMKDNTFDPDESDSDLGEYVEPPAEEEVVTDLNSQPWFHGSIDRRGAERLLKNNGDFLVREKSDGSGTYVISVLANGMNKHFILNKTPENYVECYTATELEGLKSYYLIHGARRQADIFLGYRQHAVTKGKYKFESDAFEGVQDLIHYHLKHKLPIKTADRVILVSPVKRAFIMGDKFSFTHEDVRLENKLGNGHFGDVYRGVILKRNLPVAIKTCRENVDEIQKKKFLEEAEIMKPYDHPNVVKLIGVCNDREPFYILMELLPNGDLLEFLKNKGMELGMADLLKMTVDAASGMAYLEKKNTIHRDLAARNCLVGENSVVKISDFGMSREEDNEGIYAIQTTKEIPIKWTAPEVWNYQQYTTKSDVWSFGVLMWEIFTLGSAPYPGWSNRQAREQIEAGYRMPIPSGTPLKVYEVMQSCWKIREDERPHFDQLYKKLKSLQKEVK